MYSKETSTNTSCNDEQRVGTTTASADRVPNGGSSSSEDPAWHCSELWTADFFSVLSPSYEVATS